MTHYIPSKINKSYSSTPRQSSGGFTVIEMLVSICILLPIMGGALALFSLGVNQQSSEQSSAEANQDITAALNMMKMEIAQAGSHDIYVETETGSAILGNDTYAQSVPVDSIEGLCVGDSIDVVDGSVSETVRITGLTSGTITGIFKYSHSGDTKIRLFGLPYIQGVLPPTGLSPNTDTAVTTLRFFGDIYGDGSMYYVEYIYDSNNARITRSMTPFTSASKQPAIPLITNIKPNSAQFILHTDHLNIITSVTVSLTVENEWETASNLEEVELSSRIAIPSAESASDLLLENMQYHDVNNLPPVPGRIAIYRYGDLEYAY
jgi:type II secretory pathway pseudopilin PulG